MDENKPETNNESNEEVLDKEMQKNMIAQIEGTSENKTVTKKKKKKGCQRFVFPILMLMVTVIVTLVLISVFASDVFLVVINIIWLVLFGLVVIFFLLGALVMLGAKKEASRLISIMLEGSLSLIDLADFAKEFLKKFRAYFHEFVLYITPILSYLVATLLYLLLLFVFKYYGKDHDVAIFTMIFTAIATLVIGIYNRPRKKKKANAWIDKVQLRFNKVFRDALEVVLFIFFLTMDSSNLFFLSDELNVELHANISDYDMMIRGFTLDDSLRITLTIVMLSIVIETVRNIIKLTYNAVKNYKLAVEYLEEKDREYRTADVIKLALRESVRSSMDEVLKFVTFTTALVAVFLLFPRLKLVAMVTASISALLLDLLIVDRLKIERGDDLISRILVKLFRL